MKPVSEKPSNLSEALHRQLNSYALAASAAGVGLIALVQPAEGKVVYTPAHVVLHTRSNIGFNLDLNHDGVKDFTFWHGYFFSTTTGFFGSNVQMLRYKSNANRILGHGSASALQAGVKVGPADQFSQFGNMASAGGIRGSNNTTFHGAWANDGKGLSNRYVGLQFVIKGKTHYGWARVSVSKYLFTATLSGYAYETIANKPIITGKIKGPDVITLEPGSLGALAAGVPAEGRIVYFNSRSDAQRGSRTVQP